MSGDFATGFVGWTASTQPSQMSCDRVMVAHSTEPEGFTGAQVARAAVSDIERRERNARRAADRKRLKQEVGSARARQLVSPREPYAFAKIHVRLAVSAADLIRRAISEPHVGDATGIPATMRLYRSVAGLRGALKIAESMAPAAATDEAEIALPLARPRESRGDF